MFLSVVIPTYNRSQELRGLLVSLEDLVIPENDSWEVLVIDNNSKDKTQSMVTDFMSKTSLPLHYFLETSQGSSHARNRGISEARGEAVAFIDDDVHVHSEWFCEMMRFFEEQNCLAIGGRVLATGLERLPGWARTEGAFKIVGVTVRHDNGDNPFDYDLTMTMPISANLAARKVAFEKYGKFRIDLGRGGTDTSIVAGEDTEFCQRLLRAGETVKYCPRAIVYHPILEERLRKSYCRDFYFWLGRGAATTERLPDNARRILNVPPYVIRELCHNLFGYLGSIATFRFNRIFYYELHIILIVGRISQYLGMRKNQKS